MFFDAMEIKYEYEPQGFEMDGVKYLPDFYLPDADRWIEIKGKKLTQKEIEKCERFCESLDKEGVKFTIFIGQPYDNIIGLIPNTDGEGVLYTVDPEEAKIMGISGHSYQWKNYDIQIPGNERKHVTDDQLLFLNPDLCESDVLTRFMPMIWWNTKISKIDLVQAAVLSRQARFEHGEKPS